MYWTSPSFLSCFSLLLTEMKPMAKKTQKKKRKEKVKERGEYSVTLTEHARSYDEFITMHGHNNFYLVGRLVVRISSLDQVKSFKSYFTERQNQISCARHSYVIHTVLRCLLTSNKNSFVLLASVAQKLESAITG